MKRKSWHIDRRRFLKGAGVSLGLPLLDGMVWAKGQEAAIPKRMCVFYFPFGVTLAGEWAWFPKEQGVDFTFPKVLKPLEPMRDDLTVLNGLSHPKAHSMPGHDTADIMLTGAAFKAPDFKNTVSRSGGRQALSTTHPLSFSGDVIGRGNWRPHPILYAFLYESRSSHPCDV